MTPAGIIYVSVSIAFLLLLFGMRYDEKIESIIAMLVSSVIFYYDALLCYAGVVINEITYTSVSLSLIFVILGLMAMLLAVGRVFSMLTDISGGRDYMDRLVDRFENR